MKENHHKEAVTLEAAFEAAYGAEIARASAKIDIIATGSKEGEQPIDDVFTKHFSELNIAVNNITVNQGQPENKPEESPKIRRVKFFIIACLLAGSWLPDIELTDVIALIPIILEYIK